MITVTKAGGRMESRPGGSELRELKENVCASDYFLRGAGRAAGAARGAGALWAIGTGRAIDLSGATARSRPAESRPG